MEGAPSPDEMRQWHEEHRRKMSRLAQEWSQDREPEREEQYSQQYRRLAHVAQLHDSFTTQGETSHYMWG